MHHLLKRGDCTHKSQFANPLIKFACAGVSVVYNDIFRLTMSCCVPEIFAIKSQSCTKLCRNFDVLGPPNFGQRGHPTFLTEFCKSGSPSNIWQSLVTISQVTSEIRRRTTVVKQNGWRPA